MSANLADFTPLRGEYEDAGLTLVPSITHLRIQQEEAIDWALSREEPYLFINGPTGSGKTLINTTIGIRSQRRWSYLVHTIMLQQQVARSFENLPVFVGRGNFPCIAPGLLVPETSAAEAICALHGYKKGTCQYDDFPTHVDLCPYYSQKVAALESPYRVVNYALFLRYPYLIRDPRGHPVSSLLLCDEAHNAESAVCDAVTITLADRTARRMGIRLPNYVNLEQWIAWSTQLANNGLESVGDIGTQVFVDNIHTLAKILPEDAGHWLVETRNNGIVFMPIWGAPFVMRKLMGHNEVPHTSSLLDYLSYNGPGVEKTVFTSATLLGTEYIADTLGLPEGSWAYLDLPSTFPAEHRPINYAPVKKMNAAAVNDFKGRRPMQEAIDRLIEYYLGHRATAGLIHAVSNKYRDFILTESRYRGIMTSSIDSHAEKVAADKPSVLVAANITEGWDGYDSLCRFIILPKVPYPDLGDKRTKIRMEEDPRSYDHRALVAVVQGVGRGVRHAQDYADAWILDENWNMLRRKRGGWLPQSFRDAYHHNVVLP